jgi:hypothetical protein
MDAYILPNDVRDLSPEVIGDDGHVRVMPAAYYEGTTQQERSVAAVRNGLYCLPTVELIEWLRNFIDGRSAIEIGAGNGVIARALGIPATDNKMQDDPAMRALYASMQQPPVKYGDHVERLDANAAARKYKPDVIVASWVTHKWSAKEPSRQGNMFGVDERELLKHCGYYVFVGNVVTHAKKPLWDSHKPEDMQVPTWLYSRAMNGSPEFIAVWRGKKGR